MKQVLNKLLFHWGSVLRGTRYRRRGHTTVYLLRRQLAVGQEVEALVVQNIEDPPPDEESEK